VNTQVNFPSVRNRYYILRHGESEANVARIVTSDPAQCIANYGLTQNGRAKVAATIQQAKRKHWLDSQTIIYASDFRRTAETAELAREVLDAGKIHLSKALRERNFGEYDGTHPAAYIKIWPQDQSEILDQQNRGVEGPREMLLRLADFIKGIERRHENSCLLLVSHGDPLQVLQAAFAGLAPRESSLLSYIAQAELRKLEITLQTTATNR
jgi:broad specificity phosphatase PhoE